MSSPDQTNMNPFSRNKLRLKPEAAAGRQASWQQKRRHVRASHLFLPNAASAPQGGGRVEPDQGPGTLPRSPHQSVWLENRQHESLPTESPTHTHSHAGRERIKADMDSVRSASALFNKQHLQGKEVPFHHHHHHERELWYLCRRPSQPTSQFNPSIHPISKSMVSFEEGDFPVLSLSSNDEEKKKKKRLLLLAPLTPLALSKKISKQTA
ncbi:hypothetical protein HDK90DRAFT_6918 [Phyllosticta capitalensis]|uniref:Uncharacterized protein n=1 Tax=Phyllosticta capitalensis TaxID=121624 RepID=A0ABR1Z1N5_9PEZI